MGDRRLHAGDIVRHFKRETLSEEDKEKYPDIKQVYRFEKVKDDIDR